MAISPVSSKFPEGPIQDAAVVSIFLSTFVSIGTTADTDGGLFDVQEDTEDLFNHCSTMHGMSVYSRQLSQGYIFCLVVGFFVSID